jgi:hypothetical protein
VNTSLEHLQEHVRPEKAGVFSGSQSHQGSSQNPVNKVAGMEEMKSPKPTEEAMEAW